MVLEIQIIHIICMSITYLIYAKRIKTRYPMKISYNTKCLQKDREMN